MNLFKKKSGINYKSAADLNRSDIVNHRYVMECHVRTGHTFQVSSREPSRVSATLYILKCVDCGFTYSTGGLTPIDERARVLIDNLENKNFART